MSPAARRGLLLAAALLAAAILQCAAAGALQLWGAQPDLLTTTALTGALFCDANGGAALGFFAGLFLASLTSPPHGGFGSLIVSRTLAGFGAGWLEGRLFRDNARLAIFLVALGTLLADLLFFLFAPQPLSLRVAVTLLKTALYNGVLALPLTLLLRRLLPRRDALAPIGSRR
ncbi:MAG TPA: hypothetical protein VKT32_01210 [Chthonomonadaceae bacterium]|nr:hypothetical protein [Chthonomonadaceae bacterium]